MMYRVAFDVESEEHASKVKKFLDEILDTTKHTDTVSVGKVELSKHPSGETRPIAGFVKLITDNAILISLASYKAKVNPKEAKFYARRLLDPNDTHISDIKLQEAFRNPDIWYALEEYLSTDNLRKVIKDAINRTRKESTGESQGSEA